MGIILSRFGERRTQHGFVLLDRTLLCLLLGLYDRPEFTVRSNKELFRAALPYLRLMRFTSTSISGLQKASRRLNVAWLKCERAGCSNVWRLTPRGRGIVERSVPVWIRGYGFYSGTPGLRAERLETNRNESVAFRWECARADQRMAPLVHQAEALVEQWCDRNRVYGMYCVPLMRAKRTPVEFFVRSFVLRFAELPSGRHHLARELHGADTVIDFDAIDPQR